MKRYARFSKIVPFLALFGLAYFTFRPQEFEAAATASKTFTSPAIPSRYADGFDFPVGGGTGSGYYTARRMTPYQHMGDDWNGNGGGNSDYGDPVLAIAHGKVVYSQNYGSDWGEVVIIRHKYRDSLGRTRYVDSLYGHVIRRRVSVGQDVRRGQRIASIGNNRGMYVAHLHLEIRKNIDIGIRAWAYPKSSSNYYEPLSFINAHRPGRITEPRPNYTLAKNAAPKSNGKHPEPSDAEGVKPLAGLLAMVQSKPSEPGARKASSASPQTSTPRSGAPGLGFSRNAVLTARTSTVARSASTVTSAKIKKTIGLGSRPRLRLLAVSGGQSSRTGLFGGRFKDEARIERRNSQPLRTGLLGNRPARIRVSRDVQRPRNGPLKRLFGKTQK